MRALDVLGVCMCVLTLSLPGCRGHLTKGIQKRFNLRIGSEPQTYGIGIKVHEHRKRTLHATLNAHFHTLGLMPRYRSCGR